MYQEFRTPCHLLYKLTPVWSPLRTSCVTIRALRRLRSFGGGALGHFDRRRRLADRFFSAAAASVKNRRRQRQMCIRDRRYMHL